MKKAPLILYILLVPFFAFSQSSSPDDDAPGLLDKLSKNKREKTTEKPIRPFKGAAKIVATFDKSNEELFDFISKKLTTAGYTIDKRERDLLLITTEPKPLKQINYKLRLVVEDSVMVLSSEYISAIGLQIGNVKTEQAYQDLKYSSKIYVTREAFDIIISFVDSLNPMSVTYAR
ncbi:hypothetical protein [Chitinophaga sp.]|uniref:hypothetical protein n=1 Tax=Chitinophaga sp. TaxID=1869181 RepID=UPI0031E0BA5B